MSETVSTTIDAKLVDDLERYVPPRYRGERKASLRIEHALRQFIASAQPYESNEPEPPEVGGHVDATA